MDGLFPEAGAVVGCARKHLEYDRFDEVVPHRAEEVRLERVAAEAQDSGAIEIEADDGVEVEGA